MAFNLPAAQYLMRSSSSSNRGSFDNAYQTGLKTGGNLPITFSGTQVQNGGGNEGIYFGLNAQNSTSGFDASTDTKVLITSVQFNAPNRIQVGTRAQRGVVARLTSGAGGGSYREFVIGGNDTPFASAQDGPKTICLDLSATSNDSSGGSYDNSNVTGWGYGTFKTNLVGGSSNLCFFQRVFLFDTVRGGANIPTFTGVSSFDDAVDAIQGDGYTTKLGNWCTKSGSAVFYPAPFSIGDGSSAVQFDDQGAAIISPSDNSNNQENFRLTSNAMRVYLDTRNNAADTVVLRGSYSWGTAAPWDFDISNASSCTLSGNFTGMGEFTLGSSVTATGLFDLASGELVVINGANVDSATVRGGARVQGDSVTTFTGLTVQGALDFDTAGTYELVNCLVTEVSNSSGGQVIVNISGGNTPAISSGSEGNTTVVSTATLTINNLQPGSDVVIKDPAIVSDGADNNIVARFSNVAGTVAAFTYSTAPPFVDIEIYNLGFKLDATRNFALDGNNATISGRQQPDEAFGG